MAKPIKGKDKNLIIAAIFAFLVLIGVLVYFKSGLTLTNFLIGENQSSQTKIFQSSDVMKFSITVPVGYDVSEYLGSATVNAGDKGKILIGRSGTNFNNLNDYLDDLNIKNKVEIVDKRPLLINGSEASRQEMINDNEKNRITYFIYINNWVYSISTSSESLFGDLDQIAKSFRYTGD